MDLTARDLLPLVLKLSAEERVRLARLALAASKRPGDDASAYASAPVGEDELGQSDDLLAWDAEGWDEIQ